MTLNLSKTCLGRQAGKNKKVTKKKLDNSSERKELNDSIKLLVDYATERGSSGARFYYSNISKMINKLVGVESKANATKQELSLIKLLESSTRGAILSGLSYKRHYKDIYKDVKHRMQTLIEMCA